MDFDDAKENIQPLAAGRNASILQASLRVESPQELHNQRRGLEQAIHDYVGDDPLAPWCTYISWIEQSFPSGGKESGLEEVITKCLSRFESEDRYYQDRRMIKLYLNFIDSQQQPTECYQQLFNAGIGTMVADFYICWAYHYDLCGNTRKADEIFRRGIACRAQPFELLQEAHQHFGFSVAQRLMYQDDDNVKETTRRQFLERRLALTSLRGQRHKSTVGSIRTGAAVKSSTPGIVQTAASSSKQSNACVQVCYDENTSTKLPLGLTLATATDQAAALASTDGKSVVRSIIDAARNRENVKEPGPWNKAHDKKKSGNLFGRKATTDLDFCIHEDIEMEEFTEESCNGPLKPPITEGERNYNKPFKYPPKFQSKNVLQNEWLTPVTIENESNPRTFPQYNKSFIYPRPNVEFQPEEFRAYCWFRRRGISNDFTARREQYWSRNDINANVRQYPNFAKQSRPQRLTDLDGYFKPKELANLKVCFNELYDTAAKIEYQWEELMAKRLRRNETIIMTADMEETICGINDRIKCRKSFFPLRKSVAPKELVVSSKKIESDSSKNIENNQYSEGNGNNVSKTIQNHQIIGLTAQKAAEVFTSAEATWEATQTPAEHIELAKAPSEIVASPPSVPIAPIAQSTKAMVPFEIYEDTTTTITTTTATASANKGTAMDEVIFPSALTGDFKFKTPALPSVSASVGAAANKLGFEIYIETPPVATGGEAVDNEPARVGIFDPEETCSTQTFNIFLKSQSVSTPKMAQKVASRQFGLILEAASNSPEIQNIPNVNTNPDEQEQENVPKEPVCGVDNVEFSPSPVKQLSTILETTEHGTTQGNHTTGGTTTKSSSSASDGESEREVGTRLVMPHIGLETLKEQSPESSIMPTEAIAVTEKVNSQVSTPATVVNKGKVGSQKQLHNNPQTTPANARLIAVAGSGGGGGSQFSIFEDEPTDAFQIKQAGDFTRLDEREDTAAGFAVRSVRFHEDTTETMSKMLVNSHSIVKFQEDKTETLPKLPVVAQFATENTDTMPKIQLEPLLPSVLERSSVNLDESFEFFGDTPPGKTMLFPRYEVSVFKECMNRSNTNTADVTHSKQHPNATSEKAAIMRFKAPTLFEDDVHCVVPKTTGTVSSAKSSNVQKVTPFMPTGPPIVHKAIARDSFMPDFSFIEESQTQSIVGKNPPLFQDVAKSEDVFPRVKKLEDSNLENISTVMASQPLQKSSAMRMHSRNEAQEPHAKSNLGDSYLKDFSEVLETQMVPSVSIWERAVDRSKPAEEKKSNLNFNNSILKDFSAIMDSQPIETDRACQQNNSTSTDKNGAQGAAKLELLSTKTEARTKMDLGHSYLKDFSMVAESQTVEVVGEWKQNMSSSNKELINKSKRDQETVKMSVCNTDYSVVKDSQPAESGKQQPQSTVATKTDSTHLKKPENTQPNLCESHLKDFSVIMESQPVRNEKFLQQNKSHAHKLDHHAEKLEKPKSHTNVSYLTEFSTALESITLDNATKNAQECLQKLVIEPKQSTPPPTQPLIFLDSFMKDFSKFPGTPANLNRSNKSTTNLKFLNDSRKLHETLSASKPLKAKSDNRNPPKLHFLNSSGYNTVDANQTNRSSAEKSFELNAETAMFATNISMIKNSTLLPLNEANTHQMTTPIKQQSMHTKLEVRDDAHERSVANNKPQQDIAFKIESLPAAKIMASPAVPNVLVQTALPRPSLQPEKNTVTPIPPLRPSQSATKVTTASKMITRDSKIPQPLVSSKSQTKAVPKIAVDESVSDADDEQNPEMSIYFKYTPKTPKIQQHIWKELSPSPKTPTHNVYVHRDVDLNVTNQIIDTINVDPNMNPFSGYLQGAFLEQIEFSNYIDELPSCMLVGHVSRLQAATKLHVNDIEIEVLKLVGEGAYGAVYCGVNHKTGKKYALKQERPPNFWEYYICLEVHSRLNSDDLLSAFMAVDYALIGNNASILISPFSTYGSLINVCNKVKKHTLRNVDEYVVMLLALELLSIIDHLHAVNIIHADIKADNFLLMTKLDYHSSQYALQLIDFGVSIDMKLFKAEQTFNYVHNEIAFKCVEMREGRPWTYQLDLYGLAGVIHVLLFGKFMDIAQCPNGAWMHKTHVPRYINRALWDTIFQSLLNVRDCQSMPNLQNLRALIKQEIAEKEKFVLRKVADFNMALSA